MKKLFIKIDNNNNVIEYSINNFFDEKCYLVSNSEFCLSNTLNLETQMAFIKNTKIPIWKIDTNTITEIKQNKVVTVIERTEEEILIDLKVEKKQKVKDSLVGAFDDYDWKFIRHQSQVQAAITTSLTEQEFTNLCNEMETIRAGSNTKESEIDALTTIQEVLEYTI